MALTRTDCPECGAGLMLPVGFRPGRTICCPKCETTFVVKDTGEVPAGKKPVRAASADEGASQKPKKKKQAVADDDGWSYKTSWIRFAVLGVLFAVLGVLGYMLYEKNQREKESRDDGPEPEPAAKVVPDAPAPEKGKGAKKVGPVAIPKKAPTDAGLAEETRKRVVGRWEYRAGTEEFYTVEYRADGSFLYVADLGGKTEQFTGRWKTDAARRVQFADTPADQLPVGFDLEWTVGAGVKKGSCLLSPDGTLQQPLLDQLVSGAADPSAGKFEKK